MCKKEVPLGQHTFLGRCRDDMMTTSSLMPAMVMTWPKGLCAFSVRPLAGSVSVRPPVVGTITSSGIMRISTLNSFFADMLLALHNAEHENPVGIEDNTE